MITDSDIIRILSDERLDRKILATIRRALRAPEEPEHQSESSKPLPTTWGMIPIRDAAKKYERTMEEIAEGIRNKHCKGNETHVDEDSFRLWHFDGRKRNLPKPELHGPEITDEDVQEMRDFRKEEGAEPPIPSLSYAEASARLGLSEEAILEHVLAGSIKAVGEDRVSERSVLKYEEVLCAAAATQHSPAPPAAPEPDAPAPAPTGTDDDVITTAQAAELLGIGMPSTSALASRGGIIKLAWGKVSKASVLAYKARQAARHTPPPVSASSPGSVAVDPQGTTEQAEDLGPSMATADVALRLGISTAYVSVLTSGGRLVRTGRGMVTTASVDAVYADRVKKGLIVAEPAEV